MITFYRRSIDELRREMAASIEAHREACRARGVAPSGPCSGRFNVRLPPDAHARVAAAAAAAGKSMNAWVAETPGEAAKHELSEWAGKAVRGWRPHRAESVGQLPKSASSPYKRGFVTAGRSRDP